MTEAQYTSAPGPGPEPGSVSQSIYTAALLQGVLNMRKVPCIVTPGFDGPQVQTFVCSLGYGQGPEAVEKAAGALSVAAGTDSCRVARAGGKLILELPKAEADRKPLRAARLEALTPPTSTSVAIGIDTAGSVVWHDIRDDNTPHTLVAGTTGSGKTGCVRWLLARLVAQNTPAALRMVLVDPKSTELAIFAHVPHLLHPPVSAPLQIAQLLAWCTSELDRRLSTGTSTPALVIVVEELPDVAGVVAEARAMLGRLVQVGRSAGLHVIATAQQPSTKALGPGLANFPCRIVGRVASATLVFGATGRARTAASDLLGKGDMVLVRAGTTTRLQVPLADGRQWSRLPHTDRPATLDAELPSVVMMADRQRDTRGGAGRRALGPEDYDRIEAALQDGAGADRVRSVAGVGYGRARNIVQGYRGEP